MVIYSNILYMRSSLWGQKSKFKAIFLIVLAFAVSLMLVFGTIDYIANHRTFESGVIAGCLTEEYNFNK